MISPLATVVTSNGDTVDIMNVGYFHSSVWGEDLPVLIDSNGKRYVIQLDDDIDVNYLLTYNDGTHSTPADSISEVGEPNFIKIAAEVDGFVGFYGEGSPWNIQLLPVLVRLGATWRRSDDSTGALELVKYYADNTWNYFDIQPEFLCFDNGSSLHQLGLLCDGDGDIASPLQSNDSREWLNCNRQLESGVSTIADWDFPYSLTDGIEGHKVNAYILIALGIPRELIEQDE